MHGEGQDILHTRSRRAEPRAWLRSMVWLVAAGLHPKAAATTLVVARDLADRMDYRRGLVMYDLDGTVARTGLSRATVKRHVKILRELGAAGLVVSRFKAEPAAAGPGLHGDGDDLRGGDPAGV